MSVFNCISYKNIARRPGRTIILVLLSALLCFSVTGGSLAITGLKEGLMSLRSSLEQMLWWFRMQLRPRQTSPI